MLGRDVGGRVLQPADDLVDRLDAGCLRRHQPEHHRPVRRCRRERLEGARPLVVVLEEEAVETVAAAEQCFGDVLLDIAAAAKTGGIAEVWIDPGIGFGKTVEDNVRLLRRMPAMCDLGIPVLLGVSRKSFIGAVTGRDVEDRLPGSLALIAPAWSAGVDIIRVHDVPQTCDTITMLEAVWGDR
ncbi:dihydropteroate synthase [Amycolatopsis mediterranei]|uniref:dihydropteroate synthase n=1 Tax=Amycolatopsis mediterranei TaxID=33910 RepID=UPI001E55125F|nr:dihydropteroate synthase [Amycolatopsis mediterranei]UZF76300.1 dihydropteroate synthase [Amycolatopsis mediterranei]